MFKRRQEECDDTGLVLGEGKKGLDTEHKRSYLWSKNTISILMRMKQENTVQTQVGLKIWWWRDDKGVSCLTTAICKGAIN